MKCIDYKNLTKKLFNALILSHATNNSAVAAIDCGKCLVTVSLIVLKKAMVTKTASADNLPPIRT
jgi:hypothetical protein